jgi:hypothetical protein
MGKTKKQEFEKQNKIFIIKYREKTLENNSISILVG